MFLPAAGRSENGMIGHVGNVVEYWSCGASSEKSRAVYYDGASLLLYSKTEFSLSVRLASVVSELTCVVPACCGADEW